MVQLSVLTGRAFRAFFKNYVPSLIFLFQSTFVTLFGIGLFWRISRDYSDITNVRNRVGAIFFTVLNGYFACLTGIAFSFCNENRIIYKEIKSGLYTTEAFFLAKTIADLVIQLVPFCLLAIPNYYGMNYNSDLECFKNLMLLNVILVILGNSLGFFAGNISNNARLIANFLPIFFVPFLLFAGFISNTSKLISKTISYSWMGFFHAVYQSDQICNGSNAKKRDERNYC
jgi:hypothetical protein